MPSTLILDIGLITILVCVAFMIVRLRSLFAIVMLQGVYSLVSAAWFVSLDAVDVAFTEAAVGAGVSTVLMLAAMLLADRESKPVPLSRQWGALCVVVIAGVAMFYAIGDMPAYGDPHSPANSYVGIDYIEMTAKDIHIPNVVTAVLASYRGFDTFGETVVIFAAGIGVLLLLGLNGNAGKGPKGNRKPWRASPNGINLSRTTSPAAIAFKEAPAPKPATSPKPKARRGTAKTTSKKPAAKKTTIKKTTTNKTTAKKTTTKKTASKKPAAKKPAAKSRKKRSTGGTS